MSCKIKKKSQVFFCLFVFFTYLPNGSVVKNPPANAGDAVSIPGLEDPGGGNGNPLWYFCLENPMDGGAWGAAVYGVT